MTAILQASGVTVRFGGVHALEDVSFEVARGEFLSMIGPNGAGKTTLLKAITGVVPSLSDQIRLSGREISHLSTHKRSRLGLAMTHQIVRPFHSMSVLENVIFAAGYGRIQNVFGAMVSFDRTKEKARAIELLTLLGIAETAEKTVLGQPLGIIKRVEVARALALEPKLLLLDEPLAGLNHIEAARLADTVTAINQRGTTIVMIEHNLGEVLRVSQRLVVLDNGRKIADGKPGEVIRNPTVRAAYVGKDDAHAST